MSIREISPFSAVPIGRFLSLLLLVAVIVMPATIANSATMVDTPFITSYDGWENVDVYNNDGVVVPANWGVLLLDTPLLMENSDRRPVDGGEVDGEVGDGNDGLYKSLMLINSVVSPSTYTLSGTLSSSDNDGMGYVFGYQDSDNYFRVGFRSQVNTAYGFGQGVSVQKVVNGTITQIFGPDVSFIYDPSNIPWDLSLSIAGASYTVNVNGNTIVSGSDSDLQPGRYGVHSWGQGPYITANRLWGAQFHSMELSSSSVNATHTFDAASPITWKKMEMYNSMYLKEEEPIHYGNFSLNFVNGTIVDTSNAYEWATSGTPNVDFIGTAIIVDEPGSEDMTDYELRVRLTNLDDDGIGVIFRAKETQFEGYYNFYRINFALQNMGTNQDRAPKGMSIQKHMNGIWTELFRDDQDNPLFTFTQAVGGETPHDAIPFDLIVVVEGDTISVQVIDDPDGAATVITYPDVVDPSDPLLAGTIGLTNWGSGTFNDRAVFGPFGGSETSPLLVEIGTFPEIPDDDIPGDANRDGKVDDADATILATNWQSSGAGVGWEQGDFNGDHMVNDSDATTLATNWQVGVTAAAAVPEPGSLVLLFGIIASLAILRRRSQK